MNGRCRSIGGGCGRSEASVHVDENGRLKGRIATIAKELHGIRVQTKQILGWCRGYTCLRHAVQPTCAPLQDIKRLGGKAVGQDNNVGRDEGGGEDALRGGRQAAANGVDGVCGAEESVGLPLGVRKAERRLGLHMIAMDLV
jgi:hypothetical protein